MFKAIFEVLGAGSPPVSSRDRDGDRDRDRDRDAVRDRRSPAPSQSTQHPTKPQPQKQLQPSSPAPPGPAQRQPQPQPPSQSAHDVVGGPPFPSASVSAAVPSFGPSPAQSLVPPSLSPPLTVAALAPPASAFGGSRGQTSRPGSAASFGGAEWPWDVVDVRNGPAPPPSSSPLSPASASASMSSRPGPRLMSLPPPQLHSGIHEHRTDLHASVSVHAPNLLTARSHATAALNPVGVAAHSDFVGAVRLDAAEGGNLLGSPFTSMPEPVQRQPLPHPSRPYPAFAVASAMSHSAAASPPAVTPVALPLSGTVKRPHSPRRSKDATASKPSGLRRGTAPQIGFNPGNVQGAHAHSHALQFPLSLPSSLPSPLPSPSPTPAAPKQAIHPQQQAWHPSYAAAQSQHIRSAVFHAPSESLPAAWLALRDENETLRRDIKMLKTVMVRDRAHSDYWAAECNTLKREYTRASARLAETVDAYNSLKIRFDSFFAVKHDGLNILSAFPALEDISLRWSVAMSSERSEVLEEIMHIAATAATDPCARGGTDDLSEPTCVTISPPLTNGVIRKTSANTEARAICAMSDLIRACHRVALDLLEWFLRTLTPFLTAHDNDESDESVKDVRSAATTEPRSSPFGTAADCKECPPRTAPPDTPLQRRIACAVAASPHFAALTDTLLGWLRMHAPDVAHARTLQARAASSASSPAAVPNVAMRVESPLSVVASPATPMTASASSSTNSTPVRAPMSDASREAQRLDSRIALCRRVWMLANPDPQLLRPTNTIESFVGVALQLCWECVLSSPRIELAFDADAHPNWFRAACTDGDGCDAVSAPALFSRTGDSLALLQKGLRGF